MLGGAVPDLELEHSVRLFKELEIRVEQELDRALALKVSPQRLYNIYERPLLVNSHHRSSDIIVRLLALVPSTRNRPACCLSPCSAYRTNPMSFYQRFLLSLSDLTNIVNACTDNHVSRDHISALLEELGIESHPDPSSMGTGLGIVSHVAPTPSTVKGKAKQSRSASPSPPPRSSRQLDVLNAGSELTEGFGNMSISGSNPDPQSEPERTWDTRRTDLIVVAASRPSGTPMPSGSPQRNVMLDHSTPGGASGGAHMVRRWYCVTNGEEVGAIEGWDETKALTCGYPKNCQHKCSNRQAAVQCFLDHARSKLHTVTPNSGRVVNIPGVVNMEQLRQWVRAQNGLRR
ncbi:hypothetical protein FA13DRAFT_1719672 [Coprinellus micaceus]|uniref:Uncharacterized protein n=1 Tax=Coprinellus micaceus TaxID=71717 RepID=A0A4Y7SAQ6_COPMI|nr:hypothetical protein FA13DRAFT_1719672 [Coprinellus micaceus]